MTTLLTKADRYLHKAPFDLESVGIIMPDVPDHPNRLPFKAVLTRINEPSTRPPGGSSGHRVSLSQAAVEQALPSLLGMGIDVSEDFSDHSKRTKIGIITEAHIEGKDLVISGHLFEKDFAHEVAYIQKNKQRLGASYEISDVSVRDSAADIWEIDHLIFTGAALLLKSKAAYENTSVAAHAEEDDMDKNVLDELHLIAAKIDGMQASMDADADEEAARREEDAAAAHDEAAAASITAAQRARAEADEEDASRHDVAAAQSHTHAFKARMQAAQWHTAQATKLQAAGDADAAAPHTEAATRLSAAAKASQDAASALTAAQEAREADAASQDAGDEGDEEAAMTRVMASMIQAMRGGSSTEDAAANPLKRKATPMDDDLMARMLAMCMKAMTFHPGSSMGRKRVAAAAHDDEAEDKALIKRMLKQKDTGQMAAATSTTDLLVRRKLRSLEASMELLTDTMKKVTTLLTDGTQPRGGLITDGASRGPNGGAAPTRRSMQGTGSEAWVDKFAGRRGENDGKKTTAEATADLIAQNITDPRAQMTELLKLQQAGQLALD